MQELQACRQAAATLARAPALDTHTHSPHLRARSPQPRPQPPFLHFSSPFFGRHLHLHLHLPSSIFDHYFHLPSSSFAMVNLPLPEALDKECLKAAKTLKSFTMPEAAGGIDAIIPPTVIEQSRGLVILTVIKAGFLFSGRVGFGLVIAKLPNGSWSAPSAIGTASFGAGLQIGAELTDFVIVLNTERAVDAFSYGGNVALGGNLSVAAGPVGRNAEAAAMATAAATYSYSKTKGLFAGISLEGTVFAERSDANEKLYGRKVTARELLSGAIPPPPEAAVLHDAIRRHEASSKAIPIPAARPSSSEKVHHDNLTYPPAPAPQTYQAPPPGYPPPPSSSLPPHFSSSSSPSAYSYSPAPPPPHVLPTTSPSSLPYPSSSQIPSTNPPFPSPPLLLKTSLPYSPPAPSIAPPLAPVPPLAPPPPSTTLPYPPPSIPAPPPPPPPPLPTAHPLPPPPPKSSKTYAFTTSHHHRHHKPEIIYPAYPSSSSSTSTSSYSSHPSYPPTYPPMAPVSSITTVYTVPGLATTLPPSSSSSSSSSSHPPPPLPTRISSRVQAKALYDFYPLKEGDLAFRTGDVIVVTERTQGTQDWWRGSLGGREGAFPANYVQLI